MQESISPDKAADWELLLGFAGGLIYGGADHAGFLEKFRRAGPSLAPALFGGGRMPPEDAQRMAGALGFGIWRSMPHPDHHSPTASRPDYVFEVPNIGSTSRAKCNRRTTSTPPLRGS